MGKPHAHVRQTCRPNFYIRVYYFYLCSFSDIIINTYCGCCQYRYFLLHFDLPNFYGQRHLQVSDSDLDLRGLGKLSDRNKVFWPLSPVSLSFGLEIGRGVPRRSLTSAAVFDIQILQTVLYTFS